MTVVPFKRNGLAVFIPRRPFPRYFSASALSLLLLYVVSVTVDRLYHTTPDGDSLKTATGIQRLPHLAEIVQQMSENGRRPQLVAERCLTRSARDGPSANQFLVPNIVHYIWLTETKSVKFSVDIRLKRRTFTFLNYISFLSAHRFQLPDAIFLHGNAVPGGYWWKRVQEDVENVYFVNTTVPTVAPSGKTFRWIEHAADVLRLQILLEYGGIYLDTDVIVVKSLDALRSYSAVIGRESPTALNNGVILAEPRSPFLRLWLDVYRSYGGHLRDIWGHFCVIVPHRLAERHPGLIHVEEDSIAKPDLRPESWRLLFVERYNWTENYTVHVWKGVPLAVHNLPKDPDVLYRSNATIYELMRHVYYHTSVTDSNSSTVDILVNSSAVDILVASLAHCRQSKFNTF